MSEPAESPVIPPPKPVRIGLWPRLRGYFFAGMLVTAPIAITVYVALLLISFVDERVFALIPPVYNPETYLPFSVPGIGVVLMIVILTLIGAIAAGYLGKMLLRLSDRLLNRMPVVRSIYGVAKQIVETVVSNKSVAFREVVLIEYPRKGIWTIGFLTGRAIDQIGETLSHPGLVNVFVPTTPNPTSGFLLFVPEGDMKRLRMSVEDGIKLVISAGIVVPPGARRAVPVEIETTGR
ncbi:MAG TPA: DUF502 domain-containing protein [Dongiaceae bacterium]|jgi:uncharacterized membrane protein